MLHYCNSMIDSSAESCGEDYQFLGEVDARQCKVKITLKALIKCELYRADIQRLIDVSRVRDIVSSQLDYASKHDSFLFIGDLTIAEWNEKFYVIDGLHRLESIKELVAARPDLGDMYSICVTILNCQSYQEMVDMFITINKCDPVPEHVIRNAGNICKKDILEEFRMKFRQVFKAFLSDAQNPNRPNINESNLMYYLDKSEIDRQLTNGSMVFAYMMYVNEKYLRAMDVKNAAKCKEKADKFACPALYISNDRDYKWLKNTKWIDEFKAGSDGTGPKPLSFIKVMKETDWTHPFRFFNRKRKLSSVVPMEVDVMVVKDVAWKLPVMAQRKRVTIPSSMRGIVWRKYFDSMDHECPLCNNIISLDNFECGHVVSVANGGVNHPNNLVPICGKCNKSMSSMNLPDYCNTYGVIMKCKPIA